MTATTIRPIGPVGRSRRSWAHSRPAAAPSTSSKSGATAHRTVTLTLAMPDGDDPLGRAFAEAVARRSGGSVRLRPHTHDYSSIDPANEVALAKDLERGRADIGYLPARAWAAAGVDTFRVLLAPFVVTTDAVARRRSRIHPSPASSWRRCPATLSVSACPGADPPPAGRPQAGGPPERLCRPTSADRRQPTEATFSALGADPPVQGLTAREVSGALERHEIDGAELSPGRDPQQQLHVVRERPLGLRAVPEGSRASW